MDKRALLATVLLAGIPLGVLGATRSPVSSARDIDNARSGATGPALFKPDRVESHGSIATQAGVVRYRAVIGTLIVHPKGWDDSAWREKRLIEADQNKTGDSVEPEAAMSYVAYFKEGVSPGTRPVTFLYNGGPGSSTVWLNVGAFGPRRIVTPSVQHLPGAPYSIVDNRYSLLDVSDLVFIDAPGTGFGRIAGRDKMKAFWGTDQDGHAFAEFIQSFLSQYSLWNAPKFLFGESYGTARTAVVVNELEQEDDVDVNGIVLLSQVLNFGLGTWEAETAPGIDEPYIVTLPSYAAAAWYHHRLSSRPPELEAFLKEVEQFALTDYALALAAGSDLSPERRQEIAQRLSQYTGIKKDLILKADLRLSAGVFAKDLLADQGLILSILDARFSGAAMDSLERSASYDPLTAGIGAGYVAAFNHYARAELGYRSELTYRFNVDVDAGWSYTHTSPGQTSPALGSVNVMTDLAAAMKYNPKLKVLLNGGYFDLTTPYFEGKWEMRHLPIPTELRSNIESNYYPTGHMVYVTDSALAQFHANVASFIARTVAH